MELYHPLVRELAAAAAAAQGGGMTDTGPAAAVQTSSVGRDVGRLWPRPTQLLLEEGDAVIVHWATPHAAVRNLGADVRYMVYMRITHAEHVPGSEDTLCEIFTHYEGIIRLCGQQASRL